MNRRRLAIETVSVSQGLGPRARQGSNGWSKVLCHDQGSFSSHVVDIVYGIYTDTWGTLVLVTNNLVVVKQSGGHREMLPTLQSPQKCHLLHRARSHARLHGAQSVTAMDCEGVEFPFSCSSSCVSSVYVSSLTCWLELEK